MHAIDQEARRGHMLRDPMGKLIPAVALPSIISMLVGAIYNLADTFFVGQLGNSATGAIGIVFPIMTLLQAMSFIFAHGASSYISRLLGQGEEERASRTATTALLSAMLMGVFFGGVGLIFFAPLLRLFGATETILPYAMEYARCIYIAAPLFAGSYVLNNTLRAEGSAVKALVGMSAGAVLNIALDPLCIFVFRMGVTGAGVATAVGQAVSFLLLLGFYLRGGSALRIHWRLVTPNRSMYFELLRIGLPSFFRQGLNSIASILLNNAAGPYGDGAIAAFSVAMRVMWIINAVVVGYGQGYQPISGYNHGAGKPARVYDAFRFTLWTAAAFVAAAGLVVIAFAPGIVSLFRDDPHVVEIGARVLRFQAAALPFMSVTMVANMFFQSTGRSAPAFVTATARQGLCFIPLVLILSRTWGLTGLELAQPLADALAFLICVPVLLPALRPLRAAWKGERAGD